MENVSYTNDHPPELVLNSAYLPIVGYMFVVSLVSAFTVSPLLSWYFVPPYRTISTFQKCDWNSRISSNVHAIVVSALGIYNAMFDKPTWEDPVWGDSYLPRATVALTTGFIISDLIVILIAFPLHEGVFYLIHHFAVFGAFIANVLYGPLTFFANARVIAEFSTPFVNLRWMLHLTGLKDHKVYLYNGFVMLGAFFLVRVAIIPYYYYVLINVFVTNAYKRLPLWMTLVCFVASLALDVVNIYWFLKMARGAYKMLRKTAGLDVAHTRVKGE